MRHLFQSLFSSQTDSHGGRHAMHCHPFGRHGRGHGHGRNGHAPFGSGDDDGRLMRGRKFSSDDLQLLLLALLAEQPSHGYELIKALETRTEGFYSPSPGVIYPALTYLEEISYATVVTASNKKSYSISAEGQAYLAANQARVDELFAGIAHMARKMQLLRGAMSEAGSDEGSWLPEFVDARRALKRVLLQKSGAGHDEQRRIAAILRQAAADIENR